MGQYLLDQRVDRFSRRLEDSVVQAVEVGGGIPQPVGVVDAQPVDGALLDQTKDEPVRGGEDVLVLDPDTREVVYGEEAPVVDLIAGDPPVRKPVGLRL